MSQASSDHDIHPITEKIGKNSDLNEIDKKPMNCPSHIGGSGIREIN